MTVLINLVIENQYSEILIVSYPSQDIEGEHLTSWHELCLYFVYYQLFLQLQLLQIMELQLSLL